MEVWVIIALLSVFADLRNKLAGNDKLESLLSEVLANTQQLQTLAGETGVRGDGEDKQGD